MLRETEDRQERKKRDAKDAAEQARRDMLELNWRRLRSSQEFAEQKLRAVIQQEIQNIRRKILSGDDSSSGAGNPESSYHDTSRFSRRSLHE